MDLEGAAIRSRTPLALALVAAFAVAAAPVVTTEGETVEEESPGDGWSIVDSPNRFAEETVDELSDVECVSASDCWAVGHYSAGRYTGGVDMKTLIVRWDGTSWAVIDSPNASHLTHNYLTDVTCVSASDCWAVGHFVNEGKSQTLIVRWHGTAWAIVDSPNTTPDAHNVLHAVTCTSASDCWAVGYHSTPIGAQTLVQRWDGTAWAIVDSPNAEQSSPLASGPWGANVLDAVTCTSTTDCWAVGNYFDGLAEQTLIVRWDGLSWTIVDSPNVSPAINNVLHDVTCTSTTQCWAVGRSSSAAGDVTLIQHWDGASWALVPSPNATGSSALYDVTCASASDCWAVGSYSVASSTGQLLLGVATQTLVVHWDGLRWAVVESPTTSTEQPNVVSGVTCVAASDCWSVGWYGGSAFKTLVQRWDGAAWTIVASPNARAVADHFLADVSCVSASDCWAVGYDLVGNARQAVIQHWDGTTWSIVPPPTKSPDFDHFLSGVSCVSASDCWAVGHHNFGGTWQTLTMHWDGSAWAIVDSPSTGTSHFNVLEDVTCTSATDCWAAGHHAPCYYCPGSAWQTLLLRWDGTSWTIVDSPNTSAGQDNNLSDVECVSATDCWAAGSSTVSSGSSDAIWRTLILRWDGVSWTIVESPNTNDTENNVLSGVTCASPTECWAVGSSSTGTAFVPDTVADLSLIVRWDGIAWTAVDSPAPASDTNRLADVTCASASDCWAVGHQSPGNTDHTLIQRWDGSTWTVIDSPNTPDSHGDVLLGVTCTSGSACWAVGHRDAGLIAQTLTLAYAAPDLDASP